MRAVIHWFRQDLRLGDNPLLRASCASALSQGIPWLPIFTWDTAQAQPSTWVAQRMGAHRRLALNQALSSLAHTLREVGHELRVLQGEPSQVIQALVAETGAAEVWAEHLPAPEEEAVDQALSADAATQGWRFVRRSPGGLFDWADLPFAPADTPDVFTAFRQAVQQAGVPPRGIVSPPDGWPRPLPLTALPQAMPPWPLGLSTAAEEAKAEPRSSFPLHEPAWQIGERAARAHWSRYLERGLAHRYKATRNGLHGTDFSTKLSPWLAWGSISASQVQHDLQRWEAEHGATDSSGWVTFELLWREHFRLLHLKHGRRLYRAAGLSQLPRPRHDAEAFEQWCEGRTGHALIDAGMRELSATGWLSNRMRQIVASHLIHDLGCDWRAGAAWFESRLIDFDVFSNQGNWAYIAGRGTDPRGGRRFDPDKQAREHDPDGSYRRMWGTA